MKPYLSPDLPWEYVGTSPIQDVPVDRSMIYRPRVTKDGFETVDSSLNHDVASLASTRTDQPEWYRKLLPNGSSPAGMVFVQGGPEASHPGHVALPDYWIDKYEVTNGDYKRFVDAGGYTQPKFWKQPLVKAGHELSFEHAMAAFRDSTGLPGPSGWQLGSYPKGKRDFPVNGVSWYEAAAYAEFVGKSLPTIYHWWRAAGAGSPYTYMARLSNFDGHGPSKVGSHKGISPYGAYDMAGNVREWTWNRVGDRRYILGGDWNDQWDACMNPENIDPFDRSEVNGFRCMRSSGPVPPEMLGPRPLSGVNRTGLPGSATRFSRVCRDVLVREE